MMRRPLASMLFLLASWMPAIGAAQSAAPPPTREGSIVFVGSSIFHRWTNLSAQMAPLPIVNRAVDGLQTTDMLRMLDPIVLPSRPKVIAYYCGSNDIDAGEPAAVIVDRIRQFVDRVATALPETRVVFVSVNRAPEKRGRWDVVDEVNRQIAAYATQAKHLQYVDVNPVLFNPDGTPRIELYVSDQLHFRPAAYDAFAKILKPVLTSAFEGR
ncbi:MAG: GDSL-type esterase/lipase family protein [Acidobacteriota bacterium]